MLKENAKFCSRCGTPVEDERPIKAAMSSDNAPRFYAIQSPYVPQQTVYDISPEQAAKQKKQRNYTPLRIVFAVLCAALLILGIVIIPGRIKERTKPVTSSESSKSETSETSVDSPQTDTSQNPSDFDAVNSAYEKGLLSEPVADTDKQAVHDVGKDWFHSDSKEADTNE